MDPRDATVCCTVLPMDPMDATAMATAGLLVVTTGLVYVTWRLERVTARSAKATEQAAKAAAESVEATREQATLAREAIQAQTAALVMPVPLERDWLGAQLRPTWRPPAWVVIYRGNPDFPNAEMALRNDGAGPALLRRAFLEGEGHAWEGEIERRVVPPGDSVRLRFSLLLNKYHEAQDQMDRDRVEAGNFRIVVKYADVLGNRVLKTCVASRTPQLPAVAPTHVQQAVSVGEGQQIIVEEVWSDAYMQDNPDARGQEWSPDMQA